MRVCTLGSATAMIAAMACRGATACPGDIDCDRQTGVTDFLLVLANWGTTGPGDIAGAPGGGPGLDPHKSHVSRSVPTARRSDEKLASAPANARIVDLSSQ